MIEVKSYEVALVVFMNIKTKYIKRINITDTYVSQNSTYVKLKDLESDIIKTLSRSYAPSRYLLC